MRIEGNAMAVRIWVFRVVLAVSLILAVAPAGRRPGGETILGSRCGGSGSVDLRRGWGQMSPERREQAVAYSNTKHILYFVNFAFSIVILLALLYTGLSARLLHVAEKLARRRFLVLCLYLLVFLVMCRSWNCRWTTTPASSGAPLRPV